MMIAAPSTTERGPKTTLPTPTSEAPTSSLLRWKAEKNAEVDRELAAAVAAASGFPALLDIVQSWLPLRRIEADLDAVQCDLEERGGAAFDDILAAGQLLSDAASVTGSAAIQVLEHVTADPHEALAKIATFSVLSGGSGDAEGDGGRVIRSLLADAAAQAARTHANADPAWDAIVAAHAKAQAESSTAAAEEDAAYAAADAGAPRPAELGEIHGLGQLEHANLPLAEKARLLPILNAWIEQSNEAARAAGCDEAEKRCDIADRALDRAREALLAGQPPHVEGLRRQLREVLVTMADLDPDTVDGIGEILADENRAELGRVYVHTARLSGWTAPSADWGLPYNAAAFVDAVEATGDHYFERNGHLGHYKTAYEGFIAGAMTPTMKAWSAMAGWQKALCRQEARRRPCWLAIRTAVEHFLSYVTREHATSPHDAARMVAIRDNQLTSRDMEHFEHQLATAWATALREAGGRIDVVDGKITMGAAVDNGLASRLIQACEDELANTVKSLAIAGRL